LAIVGRPLLFPVSTIESPNAITAGTVSFGGSFMTALVLQKRTNNMRLNNNMVEEEGEGEGGIVFFQKGGKKVTICLA